MGYWNDMIRHPLTSKYVSIIRNDPCVYCGKYGVTVDHIIPKSKVRNHVKLQTGFGKHHWTNIAPVCEKCNRRKDTGSIISWMLRMKGGMVRVANQPGCKPGTQVVNNVGATPTSVTKRKVAQRQSTPLIRVRLEARNLPFRPSGPIAPMVEHRTA